MPAKPGNANARRHGHSMQGGVYNRTPTYNSWRCMKERCYYEPHKWYIYYGARGIKVCERWLGKEGFKNFLADMGERPGRTYTIDRIENDGQYEPTNCRWATKAEQRSNVR